MVFHTASVKLKASVHQMKNRCTAQSKVHQNKKQHREMSSFKTTKCRAGATILYSFPPDIHRFNQTCIQDMTKDAVVKLY